MVKFVLEIDKCKGCGLCIRACPKKLLAPSSVMNKQGNSYPVMTDESACISCACCALTCPDMCITVYKEV